MRSSGARHAFPVDVHDVQERRVESTKKLVGIRRVIGKQSAHTPPRLPKEEVALTLMRAIEAELPAAPV